jgi:hypothetical protein
MLAVLNRLLFFVRVLNIILKLKKEAGSAGIFLCCLIFFFWFLVIFDLVNLFLISHEVCRADGAKIALVRFLRLFLLALNLGVGLY